MATKKLVTVQQLDRAVDGFASAVAAAGYEKKINLKALAYVDEIADTHLASSITTVLAGKLTAARARELVDQNVGKAYKPGGNATLATLPTADAAHFGYVYNMTEDFTTTDDFVEGANTTHKAGAEVAVVEVEGSDPVVYKYNVLSGYIDTSNYTAQSSFVTVKTAVDNVIFASATDIQNLIDGLSLEEDIVLAAGTYDASGNLLKSWNQLIADGDVTVTNGKMSTPDDRDTRFANVDKVVIDPNVTIIDEAVFADCTSLTTITVPDGVTGISVNAFSGCSNLTTITIPDSVTSIGIGAFKNCTNLTTITIPDSVTWIGMGAFQNCTFTTITIPDSVTTIGEFAFNNCTNLTTIHYSGTATGAPWGAPNATVVA